MPKILLMDDDIDFSEVLADVLVNAGYEVTKSTSASQALSMIEAEPFDLLITDIIVYQGQKSVPDGGILLISRLRAPSMRIWPDWVAKMPIIAISGALQNYRMPDLLKISRDMGADMVFNKPSDTEELLHAIKTLLKSRN